MEDLDACNWKYYYLGCESVFSKLRSLSKAMTYIRAGDYRGHVGGSVGHRSFAVHHDRLVGLQNAVVFLPGHTQASYS